MDINIGLKIGARFKAIVRNSKTHKITKETPWVDNLVLDSGLTRMGQGNWIDRCCVGLGTAEPLVTDIGLTDFRAASTSRVGDAGSSNTTGAEYYRWSRLTYRFSTGQATGSISEVGLGWNNANLWNKVLLKNDLGEVSPIIVLEDDYLDIVAEIRTYISIPNPTGTINLLNKDGSVRSTHNYTLTKLFGTYHISSNFDLMHVRFQLYSGAVKNALEAPDSSLMETYFPVVPTTNTSVLASVNVGLNQANTNNKTIVWALTEANAPYYGWYYMSGVQVELDPPILKSATQVLQHNALISWGRL